MWPLAPKANKIFLSSDKLKFCQPHTNKSIKTSTIYVKICLKTISTIMFWFLKKYMPVPCYNLVIMFHQCERWQLIWNLLSSKLTHCSAKTKLSLLGYINAVKLLNNKGKQAELSWAKPRRSLVMLICEQDWQKSLSWAKLL